jgi:hypothetical protein
MVADSHPFDEEQDPDPHLSEESDPDPHERDKMDPDLHWSDADPSATPTVSTF